MTCSCKHTTIEPVMEMLINEGSSAFKEALEILLNEAMRLERREHIQASHYERTQERKGYSNGYKEKHLKTPLGELSLQIPQVREGNFYPKALEKGSRSDRALLASMVEMYVQGVSTRKVSRIVEKLCGTEVSSMDVSRATAALDETFEAWRRRPLGSCNYVYLDARYEKIREGGSVVDCAVLIAMGVNESGRRTLLGVSVALSEAEAHWRTFLNSLAERGLKGMKLIVSDAHPGLKGLLHCAIGTH